MKTSYILKTLVILLFVLTASAQQGINYKAMIKDANGDPIANTSITIQFTILENGTTDVFQESHNPTTDANGIIIVNIGEGTLLSGDFNAIDWGSNAHFLNTKIDSGEGLTDMGTTEFKTVPYALYAKTAESVSGIIAGAQNLADVLEIDNAANAQIKNITDPTEPQDAATKAYVDSLFIQMIETGNLLNAGYSVQQLLSGGHSIEELLSNGAEVSELVSSGASILELVLAGVSTSDLNALGITISDLLNAGASVSDLLSAGSSISDFEAIGMGISELLDEGADLIGQEYGGGLIFKIDITQGKGYVVAPADNNEYEQTITWGCTWVSILPPFGDGDEITLAIIAGCPEENIAAKFCADYDDGTYSDWYLPTAFEWISIYNNLYLIGLGDFIDSFDKFYWSCSSEGHDREAQGMDFGRPQLDNTLPWYPKELEGLVRPVREFSY